MALWYDETLGGVRFSLAVKRTLYMEESEFQRIAIIETERFGKALLLDDAWMTAQGDEKTYHEMLVHPAMVTAPKIKRVLIIGGGDGGTAREVLRHKEVEVCDLCELDGQLVEACKIHLKEIGSAWEDPRLHVHIGDGIEYVKAYEGPAYDVVLIDGCDPVGPAAALFGEEFYRDLERIVSPVAVVATQSEDPNLFGEEHLTIVRRMRKVFGHAHPYYAGVMIYPGNTWSWTWASKNPGHTTLLLDRVAEIEATAEYYNGDIHRGAFAIPNMVKRELDREKKKKSKS